MRIEHIGKKTVKVIISPAELTASGLDPYCLSSEDPFTLMLVSNLAERVFPKKGNRRVTAEIIHGKYGNTVIYLTPEEPDAARRVILTVRSAEELVRVCRVLKSCGTESPKSFITGGADHLRLIADIPPSIKNLLPSGTAVSPADNISLAKIYEHDRIIIPENAIDALLASEH